MGIVNGILIFVVFIFNFILLLIALFLIYVGVFGEYPIRAKDSAVSDDSYLTISNLILSLSIFVGVLAFMGCYGVATDNKLYLLVYSATLLLLIAVQVFIAHSLSTKLESVRGDIGTQFMEIIKNETMDSDRSHHFMHEMQRKYNCCGFETYKDWYKVLSYIPGSCCKKAINESCEELEVSSKLPCKIIIRQRTEELWRPITQFLVIIFAVQVVLAIFSVCIVIAK